MSVTPSNWWPLVVAVLAGTLLAGCVVNEQRPMPRIAAERATTEVAADELLDVGVRLFDPNVPEDEKEREKERIYPEVRKAESRYIPVLIRDTLGTPASGARCACCRATAPAWKCSSTGASCNRTGAGWCSM